MTLVFATTPMKSLSWIEAISNDLYKLEKWLEGNKLSSNVV